GMLPIFALMATIGSVIGCWLVDRIARKGGEEGLGRIASGRQLEFVKRRVRKSAGWALALASVMPPPFPFTVFIAGASAFQYPAKKLLGVIAAGRFMRFFILGLLAIAFGQGILDLANSPTVRTGILVLTVICLIGSGLSIIAWIKRSRQARATSSSP